MTRPGYRPRTVRRRTLGTKRTPAPPRGSATWPVNPKERGMVMQDRTDPDALLTPSEVAEMFRVNPKTVTRWARAGKISAIRTLGGHRRFRESEIRRFLEQVEEGSEL